MELGIKFVSAKELYGGFYTMLMEISNENDEPKSKIAMKMPSICLFWIQGQRYTDEAHKQWSYC